MRYNWNIFRKLVSFRQSCKLKKFEPQLYMKACINFYIKAHIVWSFVSCLHLGGLTYIFYLLCGFVYKWIWWLKLFQLLKRSFALPTVPTH